MDVAWSLALERVWALAPQPPGGSFDSGKLLKLAEPPFPYHLSGFCEV